MDKKASQTSGPRNRGLRERGLSPPTHTHCTITLLTNRPTTITKTNLADFSSHKPKYPRKSRSGVRGRAALGLGLASPSHPRGAPP